MGQFDTLALKPETSGEQELKAGYVEVDVKSVGLNAKVGSPFFNPSSLPFLVSY